MILSTLRTDISSSRRVSARAGIAISITLALLSGCASTDEYSGQSNGNIYAEAQSSVASGNYDRAIKAFEALEGRAAGSQLGQQVQLDLAYAYYKNGDKVLALTTLDRFIRYNPASPALDYAYYLKGLIYFVGNQGLLGNLAGQDLAERDQQSSRDAYRAFAQLRAAFPQSRYAQDAQDRMTYIVNALSRNELKIAEFYFAKNAHQAAANRAQEVIREFPNTPANEAALYILAQAYGKMGLTDLQQDSLRVLKTNFANSAFLKDASSASDLTPGNKKPWWRFW